MENVSTCMRGRGGVWGGSNGQWKVFLDKNFWKVSPYVSTKNIFQIGWKLLLFLDEIIVSYVKRERESKYFCNDQETLIIFDVFKGQMAEEVLEILAKIKSLQFPYQLAWQSITNLFLIHVILWSDVFFTWHNRIQCIKKLYQILDFFV